MIRRFFLTLLTIGIFCTSIQVANATTIQISGTGTWTTTDSTSSPVYCGTTCGKPGGSWSFAFDLPNPVSANPTTQGTNFTFNNNLLNIANSSGSVFVQKLSETFAYTGGIAFDPSKMEKSLTVEKRIDDFGS